MAYASPLHRMDGIRRRNISDGNWTTFSAPLNQMDQDRYGDTGESDEERA